MKIARISKVSLVASTIMLVAPTAWAQAINCALPENAAVAACLSLPNTPVPVTNLVGLVSVIGGAAVLGAIAGSGGSGGGSTPSTPNTPASN
jgi:hypothetical protein